MAKSENASSKSTVRSGVILWRTMKAVGAQRIFVVYLAFLLICCGVFCLVEPETFPTYFDAVWCVFQIITTIGFGDVVPHTVIVRVIGIVVGLSALFVVALLTGITVSFFNEKMRLRRNESFLAFDHGMENLTKLSPEELARLETHYRAFRKQNKL